MSTPRVPRYTPADLARFQNQPYTPAEQSKADGYLRDKFLRMFPGCFEPGWKPQSVIEVAK